MTYAVKEVFATIQGEGAMLGRPAVFCRFAGCNLWSGREEDRATAACRFCDTDFVGTDGPGGGRFDSADALAAAIEAAWRGGPYHRLVVFTGGEPSLQLDLRLANACRRRGFRLALETNGTRRITFPLDWITVSPKAGAPLAQDWGHDLKVVYPQPGLDLYALLQLPFARRWLSPMAGPDLAANTAAAAAFCMEHPEWSLAIQAHKAWGLP